MAKRRSRERWEPAPQAEHVTAPASRCSGADDRLLLASCRDDFDAFAQLFRRNAGRVKALLADRVADDDLADHLLEMAFARLLFGEVEPQLPEGQPLDEWLAEVALSARQDRVHTMDGATARRRHDTLAPESSTE